MKLLEILSTIIINAGIANGFLFALYLYISKSINRNQYWLMTILMSLSLIVLSINYLQPYIEYRFGVHYFISGPFMFLLGPFLYFYLRSIVESKRIGINSFILHALPFFGHFALFVPAYISGDHSGYSFFLKNASGSLWIILIAQLLYYLVQINRISKTYQQTLKDGYSNVEGLEVGWLKNITWIIVAILFFVVVVAPMLVHGLSITAFYPISCTFFSLLLFYIAYKGFQQRVPKDDPNLMVNHHGKEDPNLDNLKEQLLQYMKLHKPYLVPELTLVDLAKQLEISRNQLSQVINGGVGENFYHFVNSYRIEEVKRLIDLDKSRVYTILSLANDAGFNSKSSFNNIFKKITGLTPSEYRDRQI